MACASQLKCRLLHFVVRTPNLIRQDATICSLTQIRSLHTADPRWQERLSITFGPHIDGLLKKKRGTTKGVFADGRKGRTTKRASVDKIAAELGVANLNDQAASSSTDRKRLLQDSSKSLSENVETEPEAPRHSDVSADDQTSVPDQVTLELSGDAYDTISQSGNFQTHPRIIEPQASRHRRGEVEILSRRRSAVDHAKSSALHPFQKGTNKTEVASVKPPMTPFRRTEPWQVQKDALQRKFGEQGWAPRKKLSPDAMEGIRSLHEQDQERYTTEVLSQQFKMSPEAIRRILKSKWRPSPEKMDERRERWARRHDRIWDQKAALGLLPPRKQDRAPEGPEAFEEEVRAKRMLGQL